MPVGDIRPIKAGLREQYKRLRRNMPQEIQDAYDETIARRVAALWQYKRCPDAADLCVHRHRGGYPPDY